MIRKLNIIKLTASIAFAFAALFADATEIFKTPTFGAQVYIEPGQTAEETENLFRVLKENNMRICRIRLFEFYMRTPDGGWDFSLFDRAMKLAQKYDIKVAATFFPMTEYSDISGWKFPKTQKQLDDFAVYLEKTIKHFKQYDCIFTWVLMNEPGGGFRNSEFLNKKRAQWYKANPAKKVLENGYTAQADLREWKFKNYMTTWMLDWVAKEVRKHDATRALHVNNHSLFNMAQDYDFPQWRKFLTTLGGSAHPSWHFGSFSRREFDVAMLEYAEIINSGAGDLPWFMTELQGGNNTFSGERPMCPTKYEVAQWLWAIIATNGKGAIFWSLNAKASSFESGEWGLIDFLGKPSDRLLAAAEVAKCVDSNADIFADAKKYDSKVTIVYVKESLQTEKEMAIYRKEKSMIWPEINGFFKAYARLGIGATLSSFDEFDFSKDSYEGETLILANQIALSKGSSKKLENFVSKGGVLIVSGLTGYYDEDLQCVMMTGFEYENLFGGRIAEFKHIDYSETIKLGENTLNANKWKGIIRPSQNAETLFQKDGDALAIKNKFGKGRTIWIPSLIASHQENFAKWLKETLVWNPPVRFAEFNPFAQMKLMKTKGGYIGIVTNNFYQYISKSFWGSYKEKPREIEFLTELKNPRILYANKGATIEDNVLNTLDEETVVIFWPDEQ